MWLLSTSPDPPHSHPSHFSQSILLFKAATQKDFNGVKMSTQTVEWRPCFCPILSPFSETHVPIIPNNLQTPECATHSPTLGLHACYFLHLKFPLSYCRRTFLVFPPSFATFLVTNLESRDHLYFALQRLCTCTYACG